MEIFDFFTSMTLKALEDLVANGQEENLWIDFKLPNGSELKSADDKRNFAKALSGFANSSGGLVIWGVDARKNQANIDCAVALKPLEDAKLFLTRLNSLTGDGVDPIVNGVIHRAIYSSENKGYVLTMVPESDAGPHMAKLGEDRYFKRSGDSFYKMEHYDIADMFGKRKKPKLELFYKLDYSSYNPDVIIGISNSGRATACAPYVSLGCDGPYSRDRYGLDGNGAEGLPYQSSKNSNMPWNYGGSMDLAIHPKTTREFAKLTTGFGDRALHLDELKVRYAIACQDQPLDEGMLVIPLKPGR